MMRGSDASRKRPLSRTPRAPATLRALLPLVAVAGLLCPSAVAAQVADTAMVGAGSLAPATPLLEGCRPVGVELAPLHLDRARVAEIQGRSP
ncbi:MAG TPA: hypothetical protein VK966_11820, partial [Longimicrobiales bacterium]|nr:hypothetical protein [Longimicrobiales bacterium]